MMINEYGSGTLCDMSDPKALHEAKLLTLNIDKAKARLGWEPKMNIRECVAMTARWYKDYSTCNVYDLCVKQIAQYTK